jgi:hypothetical protein
VANFVGKFGDLSIPMEILTRGVGDLTRWNGSVQTRFQFGLACRYFASLVIHVKRFALVHIGYDLSQEFSFLNETRGVGQDFMVYLDETNVLERKVNFLNCSEMNWNLFLLGERMKFFL